MIGVPGTAHRLFGALREEGISVILISQGSSEHSICCAIPQEQAERAAAIVRRAFERELTEGQIQNVDVDPDLRDPRRGRRRHGRHARASPPRCSARSATRASTCARSRRAPPSATSRWWSTASSATRALRAVHAGFYLSPHTLSIGVIGPGTVGRVLLDQLASQRERLRERVQDRPARARHSCARKRMLLADRGIDLERLARALEHRPTRGGPRALRRARARRLPAAHGADRLHGELPRSRAHYRRLARAPASTSSRPTRRPTAATLAYYGSLQAARRSGGAHYLYEATVGAGLPVIQTLRDLRETGDEIASIEGIFSGTLAYLFNVYDGRTPFSAIVRDAQAARLHRARSAR